MATSFSGGGSRSSLTMGKQLVNFITCVISAISWRPVLVVEEAGVSERTTDPGQATFFLIYKAGREPTPYW